MFRVEVSRREKTKIPRRRYDALNGLRGISTIVIALFHVPFAWSYGGSAVMNNTFHLVDFFLVLSGFVMTHGFEGRIGHNLTYRNFILDRFARIYPLHLLFLLVFLGYECAKLIAFNYGVELTKPAFVESNGTTFLTNALMIHAMGLHDGYSYNVPSWTVSVEFVTYLLFGMALVFARSPRARILVALGAGFLSAVFLYTVPQKFMHATYDYGLFRGVYGFSLGYLAYHLSGFIQRGGAKLPFAGFVECAALVGISMFIVNIGDDSPFAVLSSLIFGLTMVVFSFDGGFISKFMARRPVQLLGNWSYPIYLGHFLMISLVGIIIRHGMGVEDIKAIAHLTGNMFIVLYVVITISLAAFLHTRFEMPAKHWAYPKLRNGADALACWIDAARAEIMPVRMTVVTSAIMVAVIFWQAGKRHIYPDRPDKIFAEGAVLTPWVQTYYQRPSPRMQRMHKRADGSTSSRF